MNKKDYSITISMISYNDEPILNDCLESIRNQDYDQNLINILLIDGGSNDKTIEIAKSYGATVISRPDLKNKPNIRVGLSFQVPQTDLILSFSADNRFQEKNTISEMVKTFCHSDVVACETLRYGYRKTDPILSRYFALIGGCDPIAIGLGKADRGPHDNRQIWHSFGKINDLGDYYKIKFESDISKIPTIGANGFLIRRNLIEKMGSKENGAHTDMCVSLIRKGYNTFAFIKNCHIIHYINIRPILFLKRRLLWANTYSSDKIRREYSVFQKKNTICLFFLIFFNLTLIIPFFRSLKGYLSVRDIAWFLHPIMCFFFTLSYSWFFLKKYLSNN